MSVRWSLILLAILLPCLGARAAGPAQSPKRPGIGDLLPLLSAGTPDALAGAIRGFLVRSLPNPLYEARPNWGHTDEARALRFKGIRPYFKEVQKNDGKWKHITAWALNPADTLVFDIRNLQHAAPGRVTFVAYLSFDARVEYEQQNWQNGVRLYSGSVRARFRVRTTLWCEFTYRVELGDLLLPDAVVRLRVIRSNVAYDNFVTEHMAGFGGELAELLGDLVRGGLNRFQPNLERDLLAKANAAIEKAADTREVRFSLSEMLKKKGWWPLLKPKNEAKPPASEPGKQDPGPPLKSSCAHTSCAGHLNEVARTLRVRGI
jgi:hypothetical protein